MNIAILTDLHANLFALERLLQSFEAESVDQVICLGDTIAIGNLPIETLDLLRKQENWIFVRGNHEENFLHDFKNCQGCDLQTEQMEHYQWLRRTLEPRKDLRIFIESFLPDYKLEHEDREGVKKIYFAHYPYHIDMKQTPPQQIFHSNILKKDDLGSIRESNIFSEIPAEYLFFGHLHDNITQKLEKQEIRFVGAAGCSNLASTVEYILLKLNEGQPLKTTHFIMGYDSKEYIQLFEDKRIPARKMIIQTFFKNCNIYG